MIHIRRAVPLDARAMAHLLNAIIRKGGTTAYTDQITDETIKAWFAKAPHQSVWHVAENETGALLGFQSIEPHLKLPPEACDIATFVKVGQTGLGIGSKLFDASSAAAFKMGYSWINATIRADNTGGLAYYQSRGFETYAMHENQQLSDGTIVGKVSKRYDL
ncbi:MAG: N-acetyltransferase family protein [Roseobacter sp.]